MKFKSLLFAGVVILAVNVKAQTTLSGDHIVDGNLNVGNSGSKKTLEVSGSAKISGKAGIGTISPTAQAHVVTGTSTTKGLVVQGAASQTANLEEWQDSSGSVFGSIGATGNFTLNATPGDNMKIYVKQTGAASGSYFFAARFEMDPGGSAIARSHGLYAEAKGYNNTSDYAGAMEARALGLGSSGTTPRLIGLSSYGFHLGSGLAVTNAYGTISYAGFYSGGSTGSFTNAYGISAEASGPLGAGQTVDNATAVYANAYATLNGRGIHINSVNSGSNAYGIHLNTVTSGSGGVNYGLYIAGGSNNYMAGRLGIGTAFPSTSTMLDVNGNVRVSGSLTVSGTSAFTTSSANGLVFGGTYGSGTIPIEGAGARVMWQPSKGAFRAGVVSGTQWNNSMVGAYSIGMGYNVVASGTNAVALGTNSTASGLYATALGSGSVASGTNTLAAGGGAASGTGSVAMGASAAYGDYATALGASIAEGKFSTSLGTAYAEGENSTALGIGWAISAYSLVIGRNNHVEGTENRTDWVDGDPIFVIGNGTGDSEDPPEVQTRNALTVYKNGKIKMECQGDISMGEFGE